MILNRIVYTVLCGLKRAVKINPKEGGIVQNIDNVIEELRIDGAVSNRTGKPYKVLVIKLINGYEVKVFPHPAEMNVIESLLKGAK